ncbi:UNVERIFIED_CONTAM: hypothetical protein Sindi_3024000, partial [Sesamum indicum]
NVMRNCLKIHVRYLIKIMQHHLYLPIPSISALVLCRSTRISQHPDRYGFLGLTSQLDDYPTTYREAIYDIDSNKWLEAMKIRNGLDGSNG